MRALAIVVALGTGCSNHCKEVEHARLALAQHGASSRGADVRVTVPYDQANRVIAGLLAQEPVTMELTPPQLRVFPVPVKPVATVREAVLQAGGPGGSVRLATRIEIREGTTTITDVAALIELQPVIVDDQLVVGFGPQNLVRVKPTLPPEAKDTLGKAIDRWVPERLRGKLPRLALDAAARQLGVELTETAWDALRTSLLTRLGAVTQLRLQLPEVPIARHQLRSTAAGIVVELTTDLPVRRGLAPGTDQIGAEIGVRISASAAAELANWAVDHGHGPQRFDRNLRPAADGAFQPRFDYIAEDRAHPLKVYSFQQTSCAFHRVGVRGAIALEGDTLRATVLDRQLEAQSANPVIELGAWAKLLFTGWVDRSRRIAAHTQLAVGNRTLSTRVTRAALDADELVFELRLEPAGLASPASAPAPSSGRRARPSSERPASRGTRRAAYRTRC